MSETTSEVLENRRGGRRQPVLWKSVLTVGDYSFDCVMYNVSLQGARVKLDLPLKEGADAVLDIKNEWTVRAKVAWQEDGYMGLAFDADASDVKVMFGDIAARF
ncbi:PilZ domain-containing protein [Emcibacter nanhaiensis]|uniref:PilZ domain-containing protein n=1 Tax=Emcibacter nanhaiensis TaxID=1505037 RepID=A0A501PB97_9PROT|nr:PilZ domain-containing protein [Emcibacter nanhaiensis]TPD57633.1 PilZ domain-containing protein [Emcibacter nanhaiensis]